MTKRSGFTLVELLVAIAIFAVLSALGWKVFDYLIKIKERNTQHEQRLGQLQEAYQQVLRDTVQIVPITANVTGQVLHKDVPRRYNPHRHAVPQFLPAQYDHQDQQRCS
jgi:type II secretion system protein J